MPKFVVRNKKIGKDETIESDAETISIGRAAGNQIVLDSKTTSRKHCEIVRIKRDLFAVDLGSGNGTLLNGLRLKANERTLLTSPALLRIEEFEIEVTFSPPEKEFQEEDTDSGIIEIRMIKKVLGALESEQAPSIEVASPPAEGKKIFFTEDLQEIVIGRDPECRLVIDSSVISRKHAVLQKKWGGVTITDLKSKNGTFVNNQRVDERQLKDGDEILLGNIRIHYRNPQEIDFAALGEEYEKKEASALEVEPKKAARESKPDTSPPTAVSEEAKISVSPDQEVKPEEAPPAPRPTKTAVLRRRTGFTLSRTEWLLIAFGGTIFVLASLALVVIL